jgi:tight adherence protein B
MPTGVLVVDLVASLGGSLGVALLSAVLAAGVVSIVLIVNDRRRRRSVRWRVGQFVGSSEQEEDSAGSWSTMRPSRQEAPGQPQAPPSPTASGPRLTHVLAPEIEIAGIETSPTRIVLLTIAGSALLGIVAAVILGSPWGLVFGLIGPLATRSYVSTLVKRTRSKFESQLPDNLDVVSSALRAGHSMVGALAVTAEAADSPSRSELGRAIADEQLGVPLDSALHAVALRMHNHDLDQVAFVARLQREAGTNAAEVIDQVSENIRNRMELLRLVRTLTAQGRMARWIVSLLPVGLFVAMYAINRDYLRPLWETTGGRFAMVLAVLMVIAGSFVIKRIVEIEV